MDRKPRPLPPSLQPLLEGAALEPVPGGESGDEIVRVVWAEGEVRYLKAAAGWRRAELRHEQEVLRWLDGRAGAPRVLHFEEAAGGAWLLLTSVPGRGAELLATEVAPERLLRALARALRRLHELPVADCPFQRGIEHMMHEAWRRARAGLVHLEALDAQRRGWSTDDLLRELEATAPADEDLVFVHGDYCLPNILLSEPRAGGRRGSALEVTGLVDWGRAGVADRYQDLALLLRSFDRNAGIRLPALLAREYGLPALDEARLSFYQLLDEFF